MDKFFIKYNEPFMRVSPVEALRKNRMFREVEETGGFFAVNMNTGALTIIRDKEPVKKEVQEQQYPHHIALFINADKEVYKLSADGIKAGFQLEDIAVFGELNGHIVIREREPDGYYKNVEMLSTTNVPFNQVCSWLRNKYVKYF